jgi:3-oxoacyl-[acyl-carrier protein] reductase
MSKKLVGKVAIVTGASKGIGAAIARHLAEEGASVVVNYASSKEGADKVVKEIVNKGGKATSIHANVANHDDIKKLFSETIQTYGKVDILVNNAGVYEFKPLSEITVEHYKKIFDINVLGLLLAIQEAVKHFKNGGSIINISSIASTSRLPETTVYSATKAAVDSITRTLASELGPKKIRVNTVNPGLIDTEGVRTLNKTDFNQEILEHTPLGRIGLPDDIAPAVVYLASDDSSWMSGEAIFISGGHRS